MIDRIAQGRGIAREPSQQGSHLSFRAPQDKRGSQIKQRKKNRRGGRMMLVKKRSSVQIERATTSSEQKGEPALHGTIF